MDKSVNIGDKFNRITITNIYMVRSNNGRNRTHIDGICDCGNIIKSRVFCDIKSGRSKSCGCLKCGRKNKFTLKDKFCIHCKEQFYRTIYRQGTIESSREFNERRFCGLNCCYIWTKGDKHHNYINGTRKRKDGYIRLSDDRYVHRVVMEEKIGRKLLSTEHVHHIDGNPSNNDINNLELMSNVDHSKLHYKLRKIGKDGRF